MAKADSTIKREVARLRTMKKFSQAASEKRMAQAIEYGIRWARENTRGWPLPWEEAVAMARIIEREVGVVEKTDGTV